MANTKLINCDQLEAAVTKVKEYVDTADGKKANSSHTHGNISNTGTLSTASAVVITDTNKKITTSSTITTTELGYLDGVSSNVQNQINGKASSTHTHGNITNAGQLGTASAVVITDTNKNITTSSTITTTELGYLDGVTSNIQTQISGKAPTSHASTGTGYGAASATNYGHAMASGTTPKANGTAAVGSETAKFARGDHVHPLQTSVSGNAGSANKVNNNLVIKFNGGATEGTNLFTFNGSAAKTVNITPSGIGAAATSHGNHVPTTETANNAKFLRNDNTWQTVTPANIGAVARQYKSATTAATAGWYRIATSVSGINRNMGIFEIDATVSGKHSVTVLTAGICYGQTPSVTQLSHAEHSNTGISKVRVVYHTTYSNNYAYLEVYVPTATATTLNVKMIEGFGWSLTAPNTAGSIPSGYTNMELTFVKNSLVTKNLSAAAATFSGNVVLNNGISIKGKTKQEMTDKDGNTVATGTEITLIQYNGSDNFHIGNGINDNGLSTGQTYISGATGTTVRTVNGSVHIKPNNTSVAAFSTSAVDLAKVLNAKAGIVATTSIFPNADGSVKIGDSTNKFLQVVAKNVHAYGDSDTHYASLRVVTEGTTSTQGVGRLVSGNNINAGTAGNARGEILLYGNNTGATKIVPGYNSTDTITLNLPPGGGTIARTADNVASATKVHTTLGTTTKAYLLGTSTAPTSTSTAVNTIGDTGVYLTTTAGQLSADTLQARTDVRPDASLGANIGTTALPWKNAYSQHYYINNDDSGTNYGRFFCHTAGTTSAVGNGRITLGNSTASGTANNAQGSICLYGSNTGYTIINPGYNSTSSVTLTLPNATGTIARTADNVASATKVHTTLGTTTKAFLLGTSTTPTSTSTAVNTISDTGVYLTTTAGQVQLSSLIATSSILPDAQTGANIGTDALPFNHTYSRYHDIYYNSVYYGGFRAQTIGTADTTGEVRLTLGNGTAKGTAENSYGRILLYGTGTGATYITPGHNAADIITVELPSAAGKIPIMVADSNNYWGILPPTGKTDTWLRSPGSGILPYNNAQTSSLGASSYPFNNVYGKNLYSYSITSNKAYGSLRIETEGTTSGTGESRLTLGNNSATKTAGNAMGKILMYGNNTGYTVINPGNNTTSNITLTLPSAGGTIATTADINTKAANYLPLAGGTMSGGLTFENDKNINWKTAAAYTNSDDSSTIAAGTALSMLKYNGSGNLHIGAGINDKAIKTGNTYINAGVSMTLRTNDSTGTITLSPGESAKLAVTTDEVRSAVTFRPTTVGTRHLGLADYPWGNVYAKNHYLWGTDKANYGGMRVYTEGTTDTVGDVRYYVGNSTASGNAGNARGRLVLYGTNTGYTWLNPGYNSTGNITVELPSATGKIPIMVTDSGNYWGILPPTGTTDCWLRSPGKGFLPYDQNGTSNLGSSSWKWGTVYATTFNGNATSATKLATARTLTIGATGKTFDGSGNVAWSLQEIMSGQGLNYDTACGTLYFNNAGTAHKGRISVYNNGSEDYVQIALRTTDTTVNAIHLYQTKTTIGLPLNVSGNVTLNNDKDDNYQAFDAHRKCSSATDSTNSTYYAVSSYTYSTARMGCVNSFGGVAALETRHNGATVGYIRVLPTGGIQLGSGKKLHIQASAPTSNVVNGDVWIDI